MAMAKPKRKPRTKHIKVLVRPDEKRQIEQDAAENAKSASEWLRTGRLPEETR